MNILIIGSNGINGRQIKKTSILKGYNVYTINLNNRFIFSLAKKELYCDISIHGDCIRNKLNFHNIYFDTIIDTRQFLVSDAKDVYDIFKGYFNQIIIFSSTLVYERKSFVKQLIDEFHPLSSSGVLGGYVDEKISIENYWKSKDDIRYTIIRPYHILGVGSTVGCIPYWNRDRDLLNKIFEKQVFKFCLGGDIYSSFIDSIDLANLTVNLINNQKSFNQVYNATHPNSFKVIEYYKIIAEILGVREINVEEISRYEVWNSGYGWELTSFDHIYNSEKIYNHTNYIPKVSLKKSLIETIKFQRVNCTNIVVHERMNKAPAPKIQVFFDEFFRQQ
ncbi:hypothetical protein [Vibrio nigripulchritudo]|uniref:hypothetical protein n=1 Tax=Vibrio nigripulchritudo TaxID=28173 RepID=UPI0003B1B7C4|nr:hypothetical protein [Vibrio nigripulchritudo]CCN69742.1 hypothetical protein VIBNISFn118_1490002 [Vibrio nigripulchritudo SFn118]